MVSLGGYGFLLYNVFLEILVMFWLRALPFFFLSKFVKFSKLYSKTALRIPISVGDFKIFCETAFL